MSFKSISIEQTSEAFSSKSGIFLLDKYWKALRLNRKFKNLLPRKKKNRGLEQVSKLKALVFSFAVGNDSLSDLDNLNQDKIFKEVLGGNCSSTCMGDFLRSFGNRHVERFQKAMIESVIELRMALFPNNKEFIITMDSAPHEHYAKKMEGLSWNYKNLWCLDSQNAYDQFGFSYLFDLRPGNTFSGKDSELWVHELFSSIPKDMDRWFRADSAYGKYDMYKALMVKNVNFAIALKSNIGAYVRKKNKHLLTWKKSNLKFFDSDKCEVAMGLYPIKSLGTLRVVFIRAPRKEMQLSLLDDPSEDGYRYYSIITNTSSFDMSDEEVIDFYRQRSTAENFIKEQKYGYDFLNFPCRRLRSNQVFGLAGTIAHNLMRGLSLMMDQKEKLVRSKDGKRRKATQLGYFSKKIRNDLINIAGKVTCSARKVKLRLSRNNWEVFKNMMIKINETKQRYVPHKTLSELFNIRIEYDQLSYGPRGGVP